MPKQKGSDNALLSAETESVIRITRKRKHQLENDAVPKVVDNKLKNSSSHIFSPPKEKKEKVLLSEDEESELTEMEDSDDGISYSTKALVYSVYRDVWKDFYDWEQRYCHKVLQSLHPTTTIIADVPVEYIPSDYLNSISFQSEHLDLEIETNNSDHIHVIEFHNGSSIEYQEISKQFAAPFLEPSPSYESCSPTNRSIFVGDDSDELPFIPFSDDPSFNVIGYSDQYKSFAWDKAYNNDLEMMSLEAIERLHFYHDISLEDIEKLQLYPSNVKTGPYIGGFLAQLHLRDLLQWTISGPEYDDIPQVMMIPELPDAGARFQRVSKTFCARLGCIEPVCYVHVDASSEYRPVEPLLTSSDLFADSRVSCGPDCYKETAELLLVDADGSTDEDLEKALSIILSVTPDLTPCELVHACRRPCKDIFLTRKKILPDAKIVKGTAHKATVFQSTNYLSKEIKQDGFAESCTHDGPCNSAKHCICVRSRSNCQRRCHCNQKCLRRRQGCSCRSYKRVDKLVCNTMRCPCYRAGIECDIDLCGPCKPSEISVDRSKNLCQNSQLQQGRHKAVSVKKGVAGFGLFIAEYAKAGDLIAEYTGHLIYDLTCLSREDVSIHSGRNYLFGLNTSLACDGNVVGNETRFINHVELKKANLLPSVKLVNEEHRIGLYAAKAIKPGIELLFDYGPSFFDEAKLLFERTLSGTQSS